MLATFDQDYRLLRDVATRWSSTLLMISQVLKLKEVNFIHVTYIYMLNSTQAIDEITVDRDFKDLHKFKFSSSDWAVLEDYEEILRVVITSLY